MATYTLDECATRMTEAKKDVHRHLPGKYHSEPNVAAILLGRVDLRVDRQQFRNHMKIQESRCAVSRVSLSCIGTGRRGGRPSQEPDANTVASGLIPRFCRGWAILLGRVDLRVDRQQFRNNMKIQESRCAISRVSLSRIGTGRRGGRPSQEPEAKPPFIYAFPANRR